jgi:hypothetical protein
MRKNRSFCVVLSLLLSSLGMYLLLDTIHRPGKFPDECILVGAMLTALGIATAYVAVEQHRQLRALARHMTWNSQVRSVSFKRRLRARVRRVG